MHHPARSPDGVALAATHRATSNHHARPLELVGSSASFRHVLDQVLRCAQCEISVVLEGESGTGKTHLAAYLHAHSARATKPFIVCDLSTIVDELSASTLFGHVKGAFTGALACRPGLFVAASGGTIFLDEIGKASPHVQRQLLNVVDTGDLVPLGADRPVHVDVRVIIASNESLRELVATGEFLPDLYARLLGCRITIPPLRERPEDIRDLAQSELVRLSPKFGYKAPPAIDERVLSALERARWTYNVRELSSAIGAMLLAGFPAPMLRLEHCVRDFAYLRALRSRLPTSVGPVSVQTAREAFGSVNAAAKRLSISRATAYRRLQELGKEPLAGKFTAARVPPSAPPERETTPRETHADVRLRDRSPNSSTP